VTIHLIRVLHIEDNPGDARLLKEALGGKGTAFAIELAVTMGDALARLVAGAWDVVLLDLSLPDSTGIESVRRVRSADPEVALVVATGLDDEAVGLEAVLAGADDYIVKGDVKPGSLSLPGRALRHAVERRRLRVQLESRERQQRAAAELGRYALDSRTVDDLLERAVATLREVLGVEYAKVLELSSDGSTLRLRAGVGWKPGTVGHASVDAGDRASQAGYTLTAAGPVVVADWAEERRFAPPPLLVEHGVASGITVTIPGAGRPFGVLGAHSTTPQRFTDDDAQFVRMVANTVASAVARGNADGALRRSEARYRSLVDGAAYGIYRSSLDGRFLQVNPALVAMLGYGSESELLEVDVATGVYAEPEDRRQLIEQCSKADEGDQVEGVEVQWRRKDGKPMLVRLSGRMLREDGVLAGFEMIAEDVTQRRALEDQLRQAQKMDAVGRLAGGVAHDFNNLLTVIMGETEMAQDASAAESDVRESLRAIRHAGESAAVLTRQLLTFSRRQILDPAVFAINDFVAQMDRMLRRLIGDDVEIVMNLAPDTGRVKVDRGQLEQVLVNLAVNARDAMPEGGRLLLETANATLDVDSAATHGGMPPGEYVVVTVSDTGTGMSEEVKSRVFEPFFTTKGEGKGTGLGLATSYGIIKQCRGHIAIYSEPGLGTTMRIYLPRVYERDSDVAPAGAPSPRGTEAILLVEDDAALRTVTARILAAYGYSVLQAGSGEEALGLLSAQRQAPVQLLMTDVVMPGMGGGELAKRVRAARPGTKVLFTSGYSDEVMLRQLLREPEVVLLQKPFTPETLTRKVRAVLDAR
jgi:PAS domain S-box-containing protein